MSAAVVTAATVMLSRPVEAQAPRGNPLFVAKPGAADPGVGVFEGRYRLTSTGAGIVRSSANLVQWRRDGPLFAPGKAPKWTKGRGRVGSPEIYQLPARDGTGLQYVLLFSSQSRQTGKGCLGRATSSSRPHGFTADPEPLLCTHVDPSERAKRFSLIDPTFFKDPVGGGSYILYKRLTQRASPRRVSDIVIRAVQPDGGAPLGPAKRLIKADKRWEGISVEAPTMIFRGGRYYLFYSGANYALDTYAVGVATSVREANRPDGTFKKYGANPILAGQRGAAKSRFCGVGHQAVVNTGGDSWRILYHAYRNQRSRARTAKCGPPGSVLSRQRRYLMSDTLIFDQPNRRKEPGVWPRVNRGLPSGNGKPPGRYRP